MQFVQKAVFSNDGISQDLVNLLGARGKEAVKVAFEKAKKRPQLEGLMKDVLGCDFIEAPFGDYNPTNKIAYQSLEKALREIKKFDKKSTVYRDENIKAKKLYFVLESLNYQEAEAYMKLISGDYDVSAIREYLFPKPQEEFSITKEPSKEKKSFKKEE